MISEETIEQVTSCYSNCLTAKASKRLRFLKKLKRPQSDLVYYYEEVIRPVMEYASPIWHFSLTSEQSKTLEAVQRRDCQIIIGGGSTYSSNCSSVNLDSLHTRRKPKNCSVRSSTSRNTAYITCYLQENSTLYVADSLRSANKLPHIFAKTTRVKNSFICYSLNCLRCQ